MHKHATKEWIEWHSPTETYLMRHFDKGISVSGFNHVSSIIVEVKNISSHSLDFSCFSVKAKIRLVIHSFIFAYNSLFTLLIVFDTNI